MELPVDALAARALSQKIGHPGIGFNTRRDAQIAYLVDFAKRLKERPAEDRETLLANPWKLRNFADDTEAPRREMRHILLHLLRPDEFERISSATHKREIAGAFSGLMDDEAAHDVDERLLAIRSRLETLLPEGNTRSRQIDFYHQPLRGIWESQGGGEGEGTGDLEALQWKKQIVPLRPPGHKQDLPGGKARGGADPPVRARALGAGGVLRPPGGCRATGGAERLVDPAAPWVPV